MNPEDYKTVKEARAFAAGVTEARVLYSLGSRRRDSNNVTDAKAYQLAMVALARAHELGKVKLPAATPSPALRFEDDVELSAWIQFMAAAMASDPPDANHDCLGWPTERADTALKDLRERMQAGKPTEAEKNTRAVEAHRQGLLWAAALCKELARNPDQSGDTSAVLLEASDTLRAEADKEKP